MCQVKGILNKAWFCLCSRFVVIAGDISPIDVISHIPVACEDNKVPYAYVPSKFVSHVYVF